MFETIYVISFEITENVLVGGKVGRDWVERPGNNKNTDLQAGICFG